MIKCPNCKHGNNRVKDSRNHSRGRRRSRECSKCGKSFTTIEHVIVLDEHDKRRIKFDGDEVRSIVTLRQKGFSLREIGEIFSVSPSKIDSTCRAYNEKKRKEQWT